MKIHNYLTITCAAALLSACSTSAPTQETVAYEKIKPQGVTGWIFTLIFWPFALTKWFCNTKKIVNFPFTLSF